MPSDKKEKKRKKERSDREDGRRDRGHGDRKDKSGSHALAPSEAGLLALLGRCCFDVSPCCVKVDRIDTLGDDRRHKKDKDRKEERRERRRRKEEAERTGQESFSAKPSQPSPSRSPGRGGGGGGSDEGSERSCTSRAETDCSRQTTARSTRGGGGGESSRGLRRDRSTGNESARSSKSQGRSRRQSEARSPEAAPAGQGGEGSVKVLNLADLRGQELPADLAQAGADAVAKSGGAGGGAGLGGGRGAEDDEVRSEGGRSNRSNRSARSTRSAAQSEGGASVKSAASVSVRKYIGYLSEPKSPAEVKKLVKDFVRQMVKGRDLGVLCADGALKPVICSISRSLDTFKIKSGEQTRRVPLTKVESVVYGNPDELNDLQTPLDEACSTMEIENGECISFKFAERKAAELFTLCMQLFVDGQKPHT